MMNLVVIGGGVMGSALASVAVRVGGFSCVTVADRSPETCSMLRGVTVVSDLLEAPMDASTLVLIAVKPQDIDGVLVALRGRLKEGAVVMSVAAGVSLERLQNGCGFDAVVRVMPNTPAVIGQGASAWIATAEVSEEGRRAVTALLDACGTCVEVDSEATLDAVVALSGCGPAYVFQFMKGLIEGGLALGLTPKVAEKLALQTVIGAAALAAQDPTLDGLETATRRVASKGGVTERALAVLETDDFKGVLKKAMKAAHDRTIELR